ncbi:MAG: N-acetyl-gamma-glutamyl-phosphate reductase [Planctomycetota bacterium]|jgi:N-acetyl-gamma-glutamyl-phosphate reductase|nr:MAG: N-acetyl-gamma-glutamyl-phosphate reductase [Planctomycetota bacterium]
MARVAILGATGYTALELLKILARHPQAEVVAATTRQDSRLHISSIHPSLTGLFNLRCENLSPEQAGKMCDIAFCCLPHTASMEAVPQLLDAGCRVVDLSADYRLKDPGVYETWYEHVHTDPTRLSTTVYGLPEIYADKIPAAELVANPGCYTSTSILALAPLLAAKVIEPTGIIIDAKSGISGAGRTPKLSNLFSECNESVTAYSIGKHRHTPEIEQVLGDVGGSEVQVAFNPHLMPMDRGIFCSIYPRLIGQHTQAELLSIFRSFYAGQPFIRVVDHIPTTKDVSYTNFCDITVRFNRDQLVIFAAIDNLIKGASGVAVQNMNLMLGLDQRMGMLSC